MFTAAASKFLCNEEEDDNDLDDETNVDDHYE